MENFYNCGIDTICLIVKTEYSDKEINQLKTRHKILKTINKTYLTNDGKYKAITFQPSNYINNSQLLNRGSLFLKCIAKVLRILKGEVISTNRIDISLDSYKKLDDYKELARLIISCISSKKHINKTYTVNGLNDLEEKTAKLDSSRFISTFYCREDKVLHNASSRLEIRYQRLSECNWDIEIKNKIKYTIELFNKLENKLECFEENFIKILIYLYNDKKAKGKINTLTDFILTYEEYIYTKNIFDQLYQESGLNRCPNNWLKNFRKTRPNALKFKSKESIRRFSVGVKEHLKKFIETF